MLNQARLKVLKVREDHVRNVLDEARKRLGEVARDQGKYSEILKLLITQGLLQVLLSTFTWYTCTICFWKSYFHTTFLYYCSQLTETNVVIRARQADHALIESLWPTIQQEYKNVCKKDVNLKMDQDNFLPPDSCGGVDLLAAKGKHCNFNPDPKNSYRNYKTKRKILFSKSDKTFL